MVLQIINQQKKTFLFDKIIEWEFDTSKQYKYENGEVFETSPTIIEKS